MELQRKLLAAAVASACALPAAALAQVPSWIQIYGRANVSYERITTENSSNTAALPAGQPNQSNWDLVDNSSRIGIRGNKDLGGGLTGLFQVESRVRLDSGGDLLSTRDSYAGLAGGFGTVRLGRTIGPVYYATYDYISMHNHDTGTSSDALLAPTVFGNQGFMNNTVWYTSPKIGRAFTVDVAYSLLGVQRVVSDSQPHYLGVVGSYDQGPLHAAASYANTQKTVALGTGANDDKAYTIGGLYDFKKTKVLTGGDASRNYVRVSAMMPVGKHEFHVNFGTVNHGVGSSASSSTSNDGAKQWTLGYNYNITKETKIYGFYTKVDNDSNGTYGAGNFSTVNQVVPVPGLDISSIAIGVRHNF
ncbi:MAG: porin [Betaproteobacteria bacterium]|nr:MAG: porin [Betaproteobacteria bacterium]